MEQNITFKLFLEKCQSIQGKNFISMPSSNALLPLILQVFVKVDGSTEKVLNSIPLEGGTCPSWTVYGLRSVSELSAHFDASEIIIKVVGISGESEITLFEDLFVLNQLFVVETTTRSLFPPNFLCLQFNGVRCTSQRLAQNFSRLLSSTASRPLQPFLLDLDDDSRPVRGDVVAVPVIPKAVEDIRARTSHVASTIESFRKLSENSDFSRLNESHLAVQKINCLLLQDKLNDVESKTAMRKDENMCGALSISTQRLQSLIAASESLVKNIRSLQAVSEEKQNQLVRLKFFLEARQQKLFKDLLVVYPITQGKSGEYSIRGIELPYDLNLVKDDEMVSSGLGYLVHALLLLSKYWEVPLRYQLLYHGSRCLVRDLASNNTIYPLFRAYNDKERFDRGMFWLRIDLEQIMQTRGVNFDPSRSLLANFVQLSGCDVCSSLAY